MGPGEYQNLSFPPSSWGKGAALYHLPLRTWVLLRGGAGALMFFSYPISCSCLHPDLGHILLFLGPGPLGSSYHPFSSWLASEISSRM